LSSAGVDAPGYSSRRLAQHQSEINQFALTPATQSAKNLFTKTRVRNESVVKFAPASVSFSVVAGRPSAICESHKPAVVKIHHIPGESAAFPGEGQVKKRAFRIAIYSSN
jgi:hypothetical protein